MTDERQSVQQNLVAVRASLEEVSAQLERLERKDRTNKILFTIIAVVIVGLLGLGLYVRDTSTDARQRLAETFEQTEVHNCETSQDERVRLRNAFAIFIEQLVAAVGADDREELQPYIDAFNQGLLEAVPDRDCEAEARERRQ